MATSTPEPGTSSLAVDALPDTEIHERLDALLREFEEAGQRQVGYPTNQNFDFSEWLPFLNHSVNSAGDPFHHSNFRSNSHEFDLEVVNRFASRLRIVPNEAWEYLTSGGTEGNMYGRYLAREMFPNAIFYFSEEMHYGVLKNVRLLNARYIMIKGGEDGEIDCDDLRDMVRSRKYPANGRWRRRGYRSHHHHARRDAQHDRRVGCRLRRVRSVST